MSEEPISQKWQSAAADILHKLIGASLQVESVESWGIGALNTCLKVTAGNPHQAYFLKIENDDIIPTTRRGQIAREVASMCLATAAGIPCPTVLACDINGVETGYRCLVEAFIDAELFWEIRETMTDQERETLRADISLILEKMNGITSPVFGDVYPGGTIGQYGTWREAYLVMAGLLQQDSRKLCLFDDQESRQVEAAFERLAGSLVAPGPAAFYHGDLGLHNVMVDRAQGFARLRKVIDFGNALFLPAYKNEADSRLYGGFGLEPLDVRARYGVSVEELAANDLLSEFEGLVFYAMLYKRWGKAVDDLKSGFLKKI